MKQIGILILAAIFLTNPALAGVSWQKAIDAVQKKSSRYYKYAYSLGSGHPGTAIHGLGYNRHICAIVGRMLGFSAEIREAETFEDPPMTPDADPTELMEHSMFLDAWATAAGNAVSMTKKQKESLWNLECVGRHGIPVSARIKYPDLSGDFSRNEKTLLVYGDIESGFFERFVAALDRNPGVDTVSLGSAGGSVTDAIKSGIEIRRRGLDTTLSGPCFSACPLVFAGGVDRQVWYRSDVNLGFHRVSDATGAPVPLSDDVYKLIARYLSDMGIDSYRVIDWMWRAGPSEVYQPSLETLCEPRMATWVQRMCGP